MQAEKSMKKAMLLAAFTLSACDNSQSSTPTASDPQSASQSSAVTTISLSDADYLRVCRGGASFRNGTKIGRIKAKKVSKDVVRLSYTRDDGKFFIYECTVAGNEVRFRMIDEAGPGTGPGNWSGVGSKTTFEISSDTIEFKDDFSDGSTDKARIEI